MSHSPGEHIACRPGALEVLALDEVLSRLEALHSRQAQIVELRFFGGLTIQETAFVLRVSVDTVKNDWRMARAWLKKEMS